MWVVLLQNNNQGQGGVTRPSDQAEVVYVPITVRADGIHSFSTTADRLAFVLQIFLKFSVSGCVFGHL